MRSLGLIGILVFQIFCSMNLLGDHPQRIQQENGQSESVGKPRNCRKLIALFATGLATFAVGGTAALVWIPLSSESELKQIQTTLKRVPVGHATPLQKKQFAKVLFRDLLKDEMSLWALWDILSSETFLNENLAKRAEELGIPTTDSKAFFEFLQVFPSDLRAVDTDKLGVRLASGRWIKADIEVDIGDYKEAKRRAGNSEAFSKLEAFFESWIEEARSRPHPGLPSPPYLGELAESFLDERLKRSIYLDGKEVITKATVAGATGAAAWPSHAYNQQALATIVQLDLPVRFRSDKRILAWLQKRSSPTLHEYLFYLNIKKEPLDRLGRETLSRRPQLSDTLYLHLFATELERDLIDNPGLSLQDAIEHMTKEIENTPEIEELPEIHLAPGVK